MHLYVCDCIRCFCNNAIFFFRDKRNICNIKLDKLVYQVVKRELHTKCIDRRKTLPFPQNTHLSRLHA